MTLVRTQRPNWKVRSFANAALLVFSTSTAIIQIIAPDWFHVSSWNIRSIILLACILAAYVCFKEVKRNVLAEWHVVKHRYLHYEEALDSIEDCAMTVGRLHRRVEEVGKTLAVVAFLPDNLEIVKYDLKRSFILDEGGIEVILGENDRLQTQDGDVLFLMDQDDQKPQGMLIGTNRQTPNGERFFQVQSWDALFATSLKTKAMAREPLSTAVMAILVTSSIAQSRRN